jgi:hypothetical protein
MADKSFDALLGTSKDDPAVELFFVAMNTVDRPSIQVDEDEDTKHYDWVLVRRQGIEIGFADSIYFNGGVAPLFGDDSNLICTQLTYFAAGARENVAQCIHQLPHDLSFTDAREEVRLKLSAFDKTRKSYITDRWDIGKYKLIVSYFNGNELVEMIHLKLPIASYPEKHRDQPEKLSSLTTKKWVELLNSAEFDESINLYIAPLNLNAAIEDGEGREADFVNDCGLELGFSASSKQLSLVKFYRARDREARQWLGELPFSLHFDDSPEILWKKIKTSPDKKIDGSTTGHALWHFERFSLHVLYSTIENHLFRITLMRPGYWQELDEV